MNTLPRTVTTVNDEPSYWGDNKIWFYLCLIVILLLLLIVIAIITYLFLYEPSRVEIDRKYTVAVNRVADV